MTPDSTSDTTLTAEPDEQEIVVTRVFDAPRERVYEAYTDPSLIPEWWGPSGIETTVDEMDVQPGGKWRYVQHMPDGSDVAFHGIYHETAAPERIDFTSEFGGAPGNVVLETVTFEEQDGRTKLTDTSVFQSVEARDATLESGMEEGTHDSMERFADLLATSEEAEQ